MSDRLLTDEEFCNAQIQYIEQIRLETGAVCHFPLHGELRDDCNRRVQDKKTSRLVFKEIEDRFGISETPYHYINCTQADWQFFKEKWLK